MKRASEVPPVVDNFGLRPVTSATAFATNSVKGPGLVTNTPAFDGSHWNANLIFPPVAFAAHCSISFFSESSVCLSLKRILKRARASPGMRLTVLFPTSTEVNSRCEGANCALP